MRKSSLGGCLGAFVVLAGLIQIVPYGHDHANPTVRQEPAWDSPATRAMTVRACYDCHSNQTTWPWYAHVAPVSWLLQRDVVVVQKSVRPERMRENIDVFDFELTVEEMSRIATMDLGESLFFDHRDPKMVTQLGSRHVD